jgi:hypothetical protein
MLATFLWRTDWLGAGFDISLPVHFNNILAWQHLLVTGRLPGKRQFRGICATASAWPGYVQDNWDTWDFQGSGATSRLGFLRYPGQAGFLGKFFQIKTSSLLKV